MGSAKSALYVNPVAGRYEQPVSLSSAPANRRGRENQTKRKTLGNNQNKNLEQHFLPPQLEKHTFSVTFQFCCTRFWSVGAFLRACALNLKCYYSFCIYKFISHSCSCRCCCVLNCQYQYMCVTLGVSTFLVPVPSWTHFKLEYCCKRRIRKLQITHKKPPE